MLLFRFVTNLVTKWAWILPLCASWGLSAEVVGTSTSYKPFAGGNHQLRVVGEQSRFDLTTMMEEDQRGLQFMSDHVYLLGLHWTSHTFDLGFSLPVEGLEYRDSTALKSQVQKYSAEYFYEGGQISAAYVETQGFTLRDNSQAESEARTTVPFSLSRAEAERPDIRTQNYSADILYAFNHEEFSYRGLTQFTDYPQRPAGSALFQVFFDRLELTADRPILPSQTFEATTSLPLNFQEFSSYRLGIGGGYGYLWTDSRGRFLLGGDGILGLGVGSYEMSNAVRSVDEPLALAVRVRIGATAGFRYDEWTTGVRFQIGGAGVEVSDVNLANVTQDFRVIVSRFF